MKSYFKNRTGGGDEFAIIDGFLKLAGKSRQMARGMGAMGGRLSAQSGPQNIEPGLSRWIRLENLIQQGTGIAGALGTRIELFLFGANPDWAVFGQAKVIPPLALATIAESDFRRAQPDA